MAVTDFLIIGIAEQRKQNKRFRFSEKFSQIFATRRRKTFLSAKISIRDFS